MTTDRIEHDFLGDRPIPAGVYWGVHTARALENFPVSGIPVSAHPHLVAALGAVKQAAVRANRDLGLIDADLADGHRPGRPGRARRAARRPVRGRRDPGRGRDLHQHERQRGDRQPGAGAAGAAGRQLRPGQPHRPRQPQPEHERRLPDRGQAGAAGRPRRPRHGARRAGLGLRRQGRGVPRHHQGGPHPAAGRRAHDGGSGVRCLGGDPGRGAGADPRCPLAAGGGQPRGDRDRHRHHDGARVRRGRRAPSRRPERAAGGLGDRPDRGDVRHRELRPGLGDAQAHRGESLQDLQRPAAALLRAAGRAGRDPPASACRPGRASCPARSTR